MTQQNAQGLTAPRDGGSRYLGHDSSHLDTTENVGHEQWRVEQMSAYGEVYSSWRDDYCRKHLKAPESQDAALSYMKTLFAT